MILLRNCENAPVLSENSVLIENVDLTTAGLVGSRVPMVTIFYLLLSEQWALYPGKSQRILANAVFSQHAKLNMAAFVLYLPVCFGLICK